MAEKSPEVFLIGASQSFYAVVRIRRLKPLGAESSMKAQMVTLATVEAEESSGNESPDEEQAAEIRRRDSDSR